MGRWLVFGSCRFTWTPRPGAVFEFAVAADREQACQLVLLGAGTVADLEQRLHGDELLRLWPELYLPRTVRAAW